MNEYRSILHKIYPLMKKMGKAVWKVLTFSLADPVFSYVKIVSISIETGGIYLVYGERFLWRIRIRHHKYFPLMENQTPTPEAVASSVTCFMNDFKISKAACVLCIPRSWAIIRQVDLPIAAKENLPRVIAFELDRLTPLTKDNARYDYIVLDEDDQKIGILLAVVRADRINDYLEALESRSIRVMKISLSTFMINSLIKQTYPHTNAVYLSLKNGGFECGTIVNALPVYSCAGQWDAGDERALDGIIEEVSGLCEHLFSDMKSQRCIVDAAENDFAACRERVPVRTVLNLHQDLRRGVPGYSNALSAFALGGALDAMSKEPDPINLSAGNGHAKPRTPFGLTVVLLIAIAAIASYCCLAPVQAGQKKLAELDRHIQELKPEVKKVEQLQKEAEMIENDIKTIHQFKKKNDLTINVIKDMSTILPPQTWLTRLRITDKTAAIEGYAASATGIILKLENAKYFQKVEFASPTFRDPRVGNERFVIKMDLKNELNEKERNNEKKK